MSSGDRKLRALGRSAIAAVALALLAGAATTALASNDYFFAQQWGLAGKTASINAPQAWCASTGGVLVADVDTGVDFNHPDLRGRLVPGARFTNGDGTMSPDRSEGNLGDGVGHGTGTTGLMVANKDDGVGIAGVAPTSKALVVKVFDDKGSGTTTDAAAGVQWAVDNGAKVINLSLGADPTGSTGVHVSLVPDQSIITAIQYAAQRHVAVAVSAGNNDTQVYASQYAQIANVALVVGAVGPDGAAAWYTSTGVGVNIYAPGGNDPNGAGGTPLNIITPYKGDGWVSWQGTSFASPHVAGVLALLMSRGMSSENARTQVINTAVSRGGLPELDAAGALSSSAGCGTAPPTTNKGPGPTSSTTSKRTPAPAPGNGATGSSGLTAQATPSAASTGQPSIVPSPTVAQDSRPSPRTLAHAPSSPPSKGPPPALIIGGVAVAGAAGFGLFKLIPLVR